MRIAYDAALPITARHDDIAAALSDHQVIVVAGETGSGKTTQLPKIAYELGRRSIARIRARGQRKGARDGPGLQVHLQHEVGLVRR